MSWLSLEADSLPESNRYAGSAEAWSFADRHLEGRSFARLAMNLRRIHTTKYWHVYERDRGRKTRRKREVAGIKGHRRAAADVHGWKPYRHMTPLTLRDMGSANEFLVPHALVGLVAGRTVVETTSTWTSITFSIIKHEKAVLLASSVY